MMLTYFYYTPQREDGQYVPVQGNYTSGILNHLGDKDVTLSARATCLADGEVGPLSAS